MSDDTSVAAGADIPPPGNPQGALRSMESQRENRLHSQETAADVRLISAEISFPAIHTPISNFPKCAVLVIAETRLVRDLLADLLAGDPDLDLVGADASASSEMLRQTGADRTTVVVVCPFDLSLPEHLVQSIEPFRRRSPRIRLVLLGMPNEEAFFLAAVRAGVAGYVTGEAPMEDVLAAVRAVARGEAVCPPELLSALFRWVATTSPATFASGLPNPLGLSRRERQLVPLIAHGMTNKQIASELGVSEQTVKNHIRRMLRKTGAASRLAVVDCCLRPAAASNGG